VDAKNRLIKTDTLDKPCRLPERHAEKHFQRQAGLDRSIAIVRLSTALASRRGLPSHGGIKPDRQRPTALERLIVCGPVLGLVGGGCGFAHAAQLPHWIRKMNPSWDLCNRAGIVCRTTSQGTIRLASDSPFDRPLIDPNYLSNHGDLDLQIEMLQLIHRIAEHEVFDDVRSGIIGPGSDPTQITKSVRANASTTWHQASTCRMGIDDKAVVGPDLRVHGLRGLRVIDASIFPTMTSGNTNAPTMMVAEKGADLVLGNV